MCLAGIQTHFADFLLRSAHHDFTIGIEAERWKRKKPVPGRAIG